MSDLKHEMRSLALKAQEVVSDPQMPTSEKREALDKIEADIKSVSDKIADADYLSEQRKKYAGMTGEAADAEGERKQYVTLEPQVIKTFGDTFTESEQYKGVQKGAKFSTGAVDVKATVSESASAIVQPYLRPGVLPILFQRLTVADLMPSIATNQTTSVRITKETTATNAASTVAEGGAKPASTLIYSTVDEPIRKIATTIKVSDEMLTDVPYIRGQIDGRLVLFVKITEEAELLTGNGTAPDLTGILNRSSLTAAQPKGGDSAVDAIYKDITKIRVASFLEPDGIVMHPNDWQDIRLSKDQNLQYYGGGPFNYGPYGVGGYRTEAGNTGPVDTLWGLRVVVTTAMTEGTALVGAFSMGAEVYRNGGLTVEATNSNEDDFLHNLVAIRAEERLGLGVLRPSAFSTVTGI